MELKFCCWNCGGNGLEEIVVNAQVRTEIVNVSFDTGEPYYGEMNVSLGSIARYQCSHCASYVMLRGQPVTDEADLKEFLLNYVYLIYKERDEKLLSVLNFQGEWTDSVWAFKTYTEPVCFSIASDKGGYAITQQQFFNILEKKGYLGQ